MTPSGWHARLELAYERRGAETIPTLRRHVGPLRVQKHFEPEPGVCEHVIVHPPAGIAGGDALHIDVAVGPDAHARLTTPGATRWYRSAGPRATSLVHAHVAPEATLEWLPQEQIVFDGADADAEVRFTLARGATLIAWDVVALGRRAGDQPFTHGTWRARLHVEHDGVPLFGDATVLPAADPLRASPLGWGGRHVLATLVAIGPKHSPAMLPAARAIEAAGSVAHTELMIPDAPPLLIARMLADDVGAAWSWLQGVWSAVRPVLVGRGARAPHLENVTPWTSAHANATSSSSSPPPSSPNGAARAA